MTDQTLQFQAEVAKLLKIVTHSLYSEKDIFLRELVSNASDACDRLRYAALTEPELLGADAEFRIAIEIDRAARMLSIVDNGIGMNRDELVSNLGTIARSGSEAFVSQLSGDAARDVKLIGQFGVGFYSAFMVADKVEVISRKAGDAQAWHWVSDGAGSFTIGEAARESRGTTVRLHLRSGEDGFLDPSRIRRTIKTYSDHLALPIRLVADGKDEVVNTGGALWARPKGDITAEQYREFYHHVARAPDEPWATIHSHAEGKLDYTFLLFVPSRQPIDLFDPARKPALKLYVRRVFITDDCGDLVPAWLRFLRGIVDSADLPLNVSREMLQNNPVLGRIRQAIIKRLLTELEKKAESSAGDYAKFWENFGPVLKEGIYEDAEHRNRLLKLARFRSTAGDSWITLADYVGRMKDGQAAIYTISGDDIGSLRQSPQIESFRAKEVEVLLLTDPVDDFWLGVVEDFNGKPFRSATRGGADLATVKTDAASPKDDSAAASGAALATLIALLKQALGDKVKDVRESDRMTESAVCLVAAEGDLDMHLERMLRLHRQDAGETPRILEINPRHALIRKLAERATRPGAADALADAAHLLLDQARIIQGELPSDAAAFARRLTAAMTQGL